MPPFLEHIAVALIVLGALIYLARAWRGKKKSGGCDSCGGASTRRK